MILIFKCGIINANFNYAFTLTKILNMYTYTMTFVYEGELGLPKKSLKDKAGVSSIILKKMAEHELTLADFNWSGNYNKENTLSYLNEPYHCSAVIEMRLRLDLNSLQSRETIYERCIIALKKKELILHHSQELNNPILNKQQNIFSFDMKSRVAA
ncbi:hypothetical protein [Flavobacterium rivuli]|nr:hypothetical protein [Flavobacterium rivuli]